MNRMATAALATAAGLALASQASATTMTATQVVPFDYNPAFSAAFPTFDKFDTMGGTRKLTGVTLSYDQTISFDITAEQNSPIDIAAGNFFADILYISLHQLGPADDGGGEGEGEGEGPGPFRLGDEGDGDGDGGGVPFLGPGAAGTIISPFLGATDGLNNAGEDFYAESFNSGMFNFTAVSNAADGQSVLDAFTGLGQLETVLAGLTEIFGGYNTDPGFPMLDPNNPPQMPSDFPPFFDPFYGVFVGVNNIRHQGTITATYEFQIIPAPASIALIGIAGLTATRRRR